MSAPAVTPFKRPLLKRWGPKRTAPHFYRAAADNPEVLGGVQLDSVEAAVTAAVRLGYKVAEAQIARTTRIAQRFKSAGDEATGGSSDVKALDATEQLVFKSFMAALGWLEGVAVDRANPLKRLASAEFRLLGSLLGLLPSEAVDAGRGHPATGPAEDEPAQRSWSEADVPKRSRSVRGRPVVRHSNAQGRRAVRIREWEITATAVGSFPLRFYRDGRGASSFAAGLSISRTGSATLTVNTTARTTAGAYRAAVCNKDGEQLGYIEIAV